MKKFLVYLTTLAVVLVLTGCSKDDPSPSEPAYVIDIVTQGTWEITYFKYSEVDKTNNFTGYAFTFTTSAILLAVKDGSTISGYWSVLKDGEDLKMVLSFSTPSTFAELGDDWVVLQATDTELQLVNTSNSGGGTNFLTFKKK